MKKQAATKTSIPTAKRVQKPKTLSRTRKPEGMSLEQWQITLRRDFARTQRFDVENVGAEPVFSEYQVSNPQTQGVYRVAIRGAEPGQNYCSCPDYAVNTLGTCKHIEFLLHRLRRNRQVRQQLEQGHSPAYSEIYLRYGAQREVALRLGTGCPTGFARTARRFADREGRLEPHLFGQLSKLTDAARRAGHELRVYDDALAHVAQTLSRDRLQKAIGDAFPEGAESPAMDSLLKVRLYPYQKQGAFFAASSGRCLIADDMGLGKTVQAIAAAEILARCAGIGRVLIVCPTTLKHQWASEIRRFSGRTVQIVQGLADQRDAAYAAEAFYKIVNYDVLHRDLEQIRRFSPELVILDEAQRIKNWKTLAARTVKQIPSEYAIVLTGTPLENRLEELHSIVEFVDRYRLGPLFRFLHKHQMIDENGRVIGYRELDHIGKTLAPVMIRRTKAQVLSQLPPRIEKVHLVPMTQEQRRHHDENGYIVARIVAKWRKFGFLNEADQLRLRCALQNMRMSCDSTYLLDPQTDHGTKIPEFMTQLGEVLERKEAKVVVFSQWIRMHELVQEALATRKCGHVFFNGQIQSSKRGELIERFREDDDCRVFLSTDAGGVGLNLQHASVVANLDLPWNPAVLEQRIGRVHRLGQAKPVHVLNFVSEGSIEHSILGLLKFKKAVFTGVLDGGESEVFLGGSRLKQFMETVQKATQTIPTPAAGSEPELPREAAAEPGLQARSTQDRPVSTDGAVQPQLMDLLKAGRDLFDSLVQSLSGQTPAATAPGSARVERDPSTGEYYVRLPLPSPDRMQAILQTVAGLLQGRS